MLLQVANLSMQRLSGKHCDVCICVAEKRFLAHKNILSACCEKLDSLMQVRKCSALQSSEAISHGFSMYCNVRMRNLLFNCYRSQKSAAASLATLSSLETWFVCEHCELAKNNLHFLTILFFSYAAYPGLAQATTVIGEIHCIIMGEICALKCIELCFAVAGLRPCEERQVVHTV